MVQLLGHSTRSIVLLGLAVVGVVSAPGDAQTGTDYLSDELIIRFQTPPIAAHLDDVRDHFPEVISWRELRHATHSKGEPGETHPLGYVRVAELDDTGVGDTAALAVRMTAARELGIQSVTVNAILRQDSETATRRPVASFEPNDPLFGKQWALERIDAPVAWDVSTGDAAIVFAALDTGISFDHEEFQHGALWNNEDEIPDNGVDDDNNGFIDDIVGWDFEQDDNWPDAGGRHGTPIYGIVGARLNNGRGVAGLANVSLMVIAVSTICDLVEATYYAVDSGSHVINISTGVNGDLEEVRLAMQYAVNNGATVVASAGNEGRQGPHYPAAYPEVIGVASTTREDEKAESSNFGEWLDLAAPGDGVLACWKPIEGSYLEVSGTSFAAPHVAGLATLMLSVNRMLSPHQVRGFMHDHADDLGEPGFDILFGHGRINAGGTVAAVAHSAECPADLDNSGEVDFEDLTFLLSKWGTDHYRADLDTDGEVRFDDLIAILDAWGPCS